MPSVYICYSSFNVDLISKIVGKLRADGVVVWYAPTDLIPGQTITKKLGDAIHEVDYFLVFASESTTSSYWVTKEIEVALQRELNERRDIIIPVKLASIDLPYFLQPKKFIDATASIEDRVWYGELLSSIQRDRNKPDNETVPLYIRQMEVDYSFERNSAESLVLQRRMSYFPVNVQPVPHDLRPGFVYDPSERETHDPPKLTVFKAGSTTPLWRHTPKVTEDPDRGTFVRIARPRRPEVIAALRLPAHGEQPDAPVRIQWLERFYRRMSGQDSIQAFYPIEGLTIRVSLPAHTKLTVSAGHHQKLVLVLNEHDKKIWKLETRLSQGRGITFRWQNGST